MNSGVIILHPTNLLAVHSHPSKSTVQVRDASETNRMRK